MAKDDDAFPKVQVDRRRDAVLKQMGKMDPVKLKDIPKKRSK